MGTAPTRIVVPPRRALRRDDAALYCGYSASKFDELVKRGTLPAGARVDGCVTWDIRALDKALDQIFGVEPDSRPDDEQNPWDTP